MKPEHLAGPACWALTQRGTELVRHLAAALGGTVHTLHRYAQAGEYGFDSLSEAVAACWPCGAHADQPNTGAGAGTGTGTGTGQSAPPRQMMRPKGHVFVAATGIVVRTIAPLLHDKTCDPAVVVCDQAGQYAISLLSGHLGKANRLAEDVAACCGGQAVITTATDSAGLPAFDLLADAANCAFADVAEIRTISAGLLDGQTVSVCDPYGVLDHRVLAACPQCIVAASSVDAPDTVRAPSGVQVVVSLHPVSPHPGRLRLYPRRIWAGVGCRRGATGAEIAEAVGTVLAVAGYAPQALAGLASVTLKRDEAGLHEAARQIGVALEFFGAEALAAVDVPHPSAYAAGVLGVERISVCEAAAVLAAGDGARLLVPKQIMAAVPSARMQGRTVGRVTVALAACVENCCA